MFINRQGKQKADHSCTGEASVIMIFSEMQRNEDCHLQLMQLYSRRNALVHSSCADPPLVVCTSAANFDHLLSALVNQYREQLKLLVDFDATQSDEGDEDKVNVFYNPDKFFSDVNQIYSGSGDEGKSNVYNRDQICASNDECHRTKHKSMPRMSSLDRLTAEEAKDELWSAGCGLFWYVYSLCNQDTYHYPPERQLHSASAEILGQVRV